MLLLAAALGPDFHSQVVWGKKKKRTFALSFGALTLL